MKLQQRRFLFIIIVISLLSNLMIWWFYKLEELPGLHGDEAWFGLKAIDYTFGDIDSILGMNTYTGIIQPLLISLSFRLGGISVFQLRISGVVINIIAVLLITCYLKGKEGKLAAIAFIILLSQSILLLISARIAWEVNSLTLFLCGVLFCILLAAKHRYYTLTKIEIFLFLLCNFIGTYNHVLFSSLSIAGLAGVICHSIYYKPPTPHKYLNILFINFVNLALLFISMRYLFGSLIYEAKFIIPLAVILICWIESVIVRRINLGGFLSQLYGIPKKIIILILFVGISLYLKYHGEATFSVLANSKLYLQFFSYDLLPAVGLVESFIAVCFAAYIIWSLYIDFQKRETALIPFCIICYISILTLYTRNCSFRYYIILTIILFLYCSISIKNSSTLIRNIVVFFATTSLILQISILVKVYQSPERQLKAIIFKTGNNKFETSAHFLPKMPLLQFLQKNNTTKLKYLANPYFIEQPILFYETFINMKDRTDDSISVDYEYEKLGNGFNLKSFNK